MINAINFRLGFANAIISIMHHQANSNNLEVSYLINKLQELVNKIFGTITLFLNIIA